MVYNDGLPFSNSGALQVMLGSESPPSHVHPGGFGILVDPIAEMAYIADAGLAVPSTAVIKGGLAMTPTGSLYVTELTAGMDYSVNCFIVRKDGAVLITSATDASDTFNGGWACALASGARSVVGTGGDGLTFAVDFNDLGSGAVNTEVLLGAVSPTFTRATAATTIGPTGLVVSVATGVARSYYDPTSLTYLGYLAEGARTNLCLQSEDFSTTWTNVVSTEASNAATAPDGATTADRLIPDAAATTGAFLQTGLTLAAASTYTFSIFAKTGATFDSIQLRMGDLAFANSVSVTYNTTTGAVESAAAVAGTWTAASSSAKSYLNGWWRFTVTATATTNAGDRVSLVSPDTGDGTNGPLLWGADVELGAFASSYIPTTTLAVVRNADVLTYPTTGWFNDVNGAIVVEFLFFSSASGNGGVFIEMDDGTNNERIIHQLESNAANIKQAVVDGGVTQANFGTANAPAANTLLRSSMAYAANDFAVCLSGGTVATDVSGTLPTVTTARIGLTAIGTQNLNGPIRRIAYYASRLTNAQLQSLTG